MFDENADAKAMQASGYLDELKSSARSMCFNLLLRCIRRMQNVPFSNQIFIILKFYSIRKSEQDTGMLMLVVSCCC